MHAKTLEALIFSPPSPTTWGRLKCMTQNHKHLCSNNSEIKTQTPSDHCHTHIFNITFSSVNSVQNICLI